MSNECCVACMVERNVIYVNKRQKGNPLLKFIRDVPWEFSEIKPDYVPSQTCGVLFLSMKYHNLHPEYVYSRASQLGSDFALRILLVWADIESPSEVIKELSKFSILRKFSMLIVWSPAEAGTYITEFRKRAGTTGQSIQGHVSEKYEDQLVEVLTKVPRVTKPDVLSLAAHYGNFRNIVRSSSKVDGLEGWGPTKAAKFDRVMHEPLIVTEPFRKRNRGGSPQEHEELNSHTPAPNTPAADSIIWTQSESIIDRSSAFVGRARRVSSQSEAMEALSSLRQDPKTASATSNMYCYRIASIERYEDDGESGGGKRILEELRRLSADNILVVVSRWYGGTLIGPARFTYISDCTRQAAERLDSLALR